MKKAATLFLFAFLFHNAQSQEEIGYTTTDIGGQFQWYPSGTITSLHVAFNARMHHSVLVQLGYNKANREDRGEKENETGSGWGGAIGYRYYFKPFPHKFFIGAKADIWRMNFDWTEAAATGESKTWTLQPTFDIGYTFFINDQAFITPYISNGVTINLKTDGENVGQGFITLIGISAGFRL
ncbi:MAG TPA: DUF3575 domain-containing protein [Chitinophagaceae bacterium]|nr:DUF3575 domain-containing protein [Chitinophagaceae bacterium]